MPSTVAKDIMNSDVITVRDEMSFRDVASFLTEESISGAPVVDGKEHLVGVVSLTDIAESVALRSDLSPENLKASPASRRSRSTRPREGTHQLLVRDVMTPTVYTVPEDTPLSEIARTMIAGRVHRLFVTHRSQVVGIITSLDMLRVLAEQP